MWTLLAHMAVGRYEMAKNYKHVSVGSTVPWEEGSALNF